MAKNYINPDIESSDDDFQAENGKKAKKPAAKKNPDLEKELFDDDSDVEIDTPEPTKAKNRKRPMRARNAKAKKPKNSGSDGSDFEPESEEEEEEEEEESSGEKSENLTDDAISDSDFIPDSDEVINTLINQ